MIAKTQITVVEHDGKSYQVFRDAGVITRICSMRFYNGGYKGDCMTPTVVEASDPIVAVAMEFFRGSV